jgi:hypothetical protein
MATPTFAKYDREKVNIKLTDFCLIQTDPLPNRETSRKRQYGTWRFARSRNSRFTKRVKVEVGNQAFARLSFDPRSFARVMASARSALAFTAALLPAFFILAEAVRQIHNDHGCNGDDSNGGAREVSERDSAQPITGLQLGA